MVDHPDFQTLALLFRRFSSLPPLPAAALQLIQQIDTGEASAARLEQIICSDPALAANFLRLSNAHVGASKAGGWPIRSMIVLLGQKSVRRIAISLLLLNSLSKTEASCMFDRHACGRHCSFVAQVAQRLLSSKQNGGGKADAQIGDAFATGLLHELPLWFLAKISPNAYNRVFIYAQRHSQTISQSFETLYGNSVAALGQVAIQSWGVPKEYCEYFWYADEPWLAESNFDLISSILYADHVAQTTEFKIEPWPVNTRLAVEVQEAFEVTPDTLESIVSEVGEAVRNSDPNSRIAVRRASVA